MDFIFFSSDSPLLSLLPAQYTAAGIFRDFQEAIAHYSKRKPEESSAQNTGQRILIVNGLNYYRNVSLLQREPEALLMQSLIKVRTVAGDAGIKLLMPEEKSTGQNLLIDLMSQGFYDFWFLSGMDSRLLGEVLSTARSFRQLEAYLDTLPPPAIPEPEEGRRLWQIRLKDGSRLLKAWLEKRIDITREEKLRLWRKPAPVAVVTPVVVGASVLAPAPASALALTPTPALTPTSALTPAPASMPGPAGFPDPVPVTVRAPDSISALMSDSVPALAATPSLAAGPSPPLPPSPSGPVPLPAPAPGLVPAQAPVVFPSPAAATVKLTPEPLLKATSPKQWLTYKNFKLPIKSKKQQTPEVPRSGSTALFFSEEDCLLTYALAFLMAAHLASSGSKTLLVELPGGDSRLEKALGLYQPEKSLREALQDFASGTRGPWQNYCFHGDRPDYALLDILPQGQIEKKLYPFWDGFFASLVHWAIMEEQYTYVFYLGFGDRTSLCWKDSLVCRRKIIAFSPWTPSFNEAPYLQGKWQSRCLPVFDGSWGQERIKKQMKNLDLEQYVIIPPSIKKDFISLTALKGKNEGVSGESCQCLSDLWQNVQWQSIQ